MSEKLIPFNQLGKAGYNRGINRAAVNRIKRNYHEDMVQPAIVSFRDGKYWIVDGQHRSQAQYEMNNCDPGTLIRCDVRTGLTYEQEADLYYRLNTGSKPLGFADKLMGLIEAKDDTALRFRDVVESCGYTISGRSSNCIRALTRAWKVFNVNDGDAELTRILTITKAGWPDCAGGTHSLIIDGLALFLKYHGSDYNRDRLISVLSCMIPGELVRKATTYYKQMDSRAFTKPYCMYSIIINAYNKGLRNKLNPIPPQA